MTKKIPRIKDQRAECKFGGIYNAACGLDVNLRPVGRLAFGGQELVTPGQVAIA